MDEHTFETGVRPTELMDSVIEYDELLAGTRLMRLSAVADLDRTGGYGYDGYTSASAFLMHRCGMSAREANREVFLARSLPHMAYAVKSAYAGHITVSQLEVLAYARHRHPHQFTVDEATLVDSVGGLGLSDTRRAADYWTQTHDQAHPGEPDEPEPSRVSYSKTWQGRWRLDGDLDPITGDLVGRALDELVSQIIDTTPREDLDSPTVRRGEALAELARRFLDSPDAPTDHGNRPHLTVVVDWDTLTGHNPGVSELLDGTVIPPEAARQLACDAHLCRLLTGPAGEILDLGRSVRNPTPAQWRALRVRDRHCQWRGCRRPAPWCDAHHIQPWHPDGPTDLHNLILICRHHHTLIHRHGWKLTGTPGNLTITRPDGTTLNHHPP